LFHVFGFNGLKVFVFDWFCLSAGRQVGTTTKLANKNQTYLPVAGKLENH